MEEYSSRINKILASSTRQKILELIRQKDRLSYAEIRKALGQMNTGQLNYHLKVIGNLISKDLKTGKYTLTEAGYSAVNMKQSLNSNDMRNGNSPEAVSTGGATSFPLSVLIGVAAPVLVLSMMTYYLFFYLETIKISTIAVNAILWTVVIFFIFRGTFYRPKNENAKIQPGRGV